MEAETGGTGSPARDAWGPRRWRRQEGPSPEPLEGACPLLNLTCHVPELGQDACGMFSVLPPPAWCCVVLRTLETSPNIAAPTPPPGCVSTLRLSSTASPFSNTWPALPLLWWPVSPCLCEGKHPDWPPQPPVNPVHAQFLGFLQEKASHPRQRAWSRMWDFFLCICKDMPSTRAQFPWRGWLRLTM